VQVITQSNWNEVLNDPANGLWLLKFYAPWCGHCKKLAPTLDKMAPYLAGKLAIGKIDCTVEKGLCSEQQVRGYPTLKVYRDGDIFDYPGQRDADSMIDFAEKMSKPAVTLVHSYQDFETKMNLSSASTVAFLAFDPKAKLVEPLKNKASVHGEDLSDVEKYLSSTLTLQVVGQVARKLQSMASFGYLTVDKKQEISQFGLDTKYEKGPILAKIEKDVDPIVYKGDMNSQDVLEWVKLQNVPLIAELTGQNFRRISQMGRPLFIGVLDPKGNSSQKVKADITKVAKEHKEFKDIYRFTTMDGKKWFKFLSQFGIDSNALPQLLVLDVPSRIFHQNATITDVTTFLQGVADGSIPGREQDMNSKNGGAVETILEKLAQYAPIVFGVIIIIILFSMWLAFREDGEMELAYEQELLRRNEVVGTAKVKRIKSIKED
jgi:protein disulfide-isomerase-like protein